MSNDASGEKKVMEVPVELMQRVVNYLQARPYAEVFTLIAEIMSNAERSEKAADGRPAGQ